MGCKCCKIIKSYIFEPQEVQTSGYINEINNCKLDELERGKFQPKNSSGLQVHKNELQNADNRHKFNNTKDSLWNHWVAPDPEKGLGNAVEKFSLNGIHVCAGLDLNPHRTKSHNVEIVLPLSSAQLPDSATKRISQGPKCDNHEVLSGETPPKKPVEISDHAYPEDPQHLDTYVLSMQSINPEILGKEKDRGNPTLLPNIRKQSIREEKLANHLAQIEQNTESTAVVHRWTPPGCESEEGECVWRSVPMNVGFEDQMPKKIPWEGNQRETETSLGGHIKVNGEQEEEDADVAEALAALEAATAGELEEED